MNRRSFLTNASAAAVGNILLPRGICAQAMQHQRATIPQLADKADYTLRIEPCTIEISPGVNVKTIAYNSQVPGPVLHVRQGVPTTIDAINHSPNPELVHWHGLAIDSYNDGAMEEGSRMIEPGTTLRYAFTPTPSGTRWYHTHTSAADDLTKATYTGQSGFLLIDGKDEPGTYDQEILLAIHHWEPYFIPMAQLMQSQSANHPLTSGSDVAYRYATINGRRLGAGEPIRVRQGQRVLMRFLNASATENVVLALPGHKFRIIAMDGNPVPNPQSVEVLSLAVAERIDAVVEMNHPGVWVLGSTLEDSRGMGLGIVVEYAGETGEPVWQDAPQPAWDYRQFASTTDAPEPDKTFDLDFRDIGPLNGSQFDSWTINGKSWPDVPPLMVEEGKRYRLVFKNSSGDQHPIHLHRHSFEVIQIGDKKLSGLKKDTVNVMPFETVQVDFVANNPGESLLHCHMQLHMDFGFMQLFYYKA
jgi:FtsP/CotA-like multicopper oxidase with cupredoxin domain